MTGCASGPVPCPPPATRPQPAASAAAAIRVSGHGRRGPRLRRDRPVPDHDSVARLDLTGFDHAQIRTGKCGQRELFDPPVALEPALKSRAQDPRARHFEDDARAGAPTLPDQGGVDVQTEGREVLSEAIRPASGAGSRLRLTCADSPPQSAEVRGSQRPLSRSSSLSLKAQSPAQATVRALHESLPLGATDSVRADRSGANQER
jgi:hypothetical protein